MIASSSEARSTGLVAACVLRRDRFPRMNIAIGTMEGMQALRTQILASAADRRAAVVTPSGESHGLIRGATGIRVHGSLHVTSEKSISYTATKRYTLMVKTLDLISIEVENNGVFKLRLTVIQARTQ